MSASRGLLRFLGKTRGNISNQVVLRFGGTRKVRGIQKSKIHSACYQCQHCTTPSLQQADALVNSRPWKLASAVCVERFPVTSQDMNATETCYFEMLEAMELECSALSQHEVQVILDRRRMAKKQSGEQDDEEDGDDGGELMTALDVEDLATEELAKFKSADRITDADQNDNKRSLNRKLCDKLVLVVKCKVGDESVWMLPYGYREEGETMKETAQRVLSVHADEGGALRAHFMGNAPFGVVRQRFPKMVQNETGAEGVKIFIFKAQHMTGEFHKRKDSPTIEDFSWITSDELDGYLEGSYLESVQKFILPV